MRARIVLFAVLALAAPARADEPPPEAAPQPPPPAPDAPERPSACDRNAHPGLADGPVAIGYYEADFASGRRACPRNEVAITERLGLIIDTPNFYGAVTADTLVTGSYVVARRHELFATVNALRFQFVQNATLSGTGLSLGQTTIGWASHRTFGRPDLVFGFFIRAMLPTATDTPRVRNLGAEIGVSLDYRPLQRLSVYGSISGDVTLGLSAAAPLPRAGSVFLAGAQYQFATWFALALDLQVQFGHRATVDLFAPAAALRFRLYRTLGVELGGTLPVAGADRHDALAHLRLTYRL